MPIVAIIIYKTIYQIRPGPAPAPAPARPRPGSGPARPEGAGGRGRTGGGLKRQSVEQKTYCEGIREAAVR